MSDLGKEWEGSGQQGVRNRGKGPRMKIFPLKTALMSLKTLETRETMNLK